MRSVAIAVLAGTSLTPAVAQPVRRRGPTTWVYLGEDYAQYRGRYYYARSYGPRCYHRRDSGSAVAAGVVGLAAGALIGSAIASQAQAAPPPPPATVDPQLAAYCARRFRSHDSVTGTYVAHTGERIVCTTERLGLGSVLPGIPRCRSGREDRQTDGPPSASGVLPGIPRCRSAGEEIVCTDDRLRPWDAEPKAAMPDRQLHRPSGSTTRRSSGKARGGTTPPPRARLVAVREQATPSPTRTPSARVRWKAS